MWEGVNNHDTADADAAAADDDDKLRKQSK